MEDKNILSMLGINIEDEKIDINLKQTKSFFENLQKSLEQKSKKVEQSIKEGKLELDELGIKANKEQITIDLKKGKSFLEELSKKIENFVQDLDKSFKSLEDKTSKKD